jgi:hypothetical protein
MSDKDEQTAILNFLAPLSLTTSAAITLPGTTWYRQSWNGVIHVSIASFFRRPSDV